MSIEVRPATERFRTEAEGRTTWHSFSFGSHYDPRNLGFASMVALNDEQLPPGTGYADHPHADLEIVTWVISGALRHTDSAGNSGVLEAGAIQRVSAGSGIVHAEQNAGGGETRFLQTWLRPDEPGLPPTYAQEHWGAGPELTEVIGASGLGIGTAGARLLLVDAVPGTLLLPEAPALHVFAASGRLLIGDRQLGPGDAVRMRDQGGRRIEVTEAGQVAVWALA